MESGETKKQTIYGDIRRIRKILKPCKDGKNVQCDYVELHKLFDAIETKAREMQDKIEELEKTSRGWRIVDNNESKA